MGGATPTQVILEWASKTVEETTGNKQGSSLPLWSLLQSLIQVPALGPCLEILPWFSPTTNGGLKMCTTNKPTPPKITFVYYPNRNQTKTLATKKF